MKAKMPPSEKPQEPGQYECIWCDTVFWHTGADQQLVCPQCGNANRADLVPIYMENSAVEQTMYTAADWHGGD